MDIHYFISLLAHNGDTLILETEFATSEGEAVLIDFMPLREHASHIVRLMPWASCVAH